MSEFREARYAAKRLQLNPELVLLRPASELLQWQFLWLCKIIFLKYSTISGNMYLVLQQAQISSLFDHSGVTNNFARATHGTYDITET